jgi:hypothetical protein
VRQKEQELEALRRNRSSERVAPPSEIAAAFILQPGLTRGTDEPEKLIVPEAARSLRLQLDLEKDENYSNYVVEIRTARGNLIFSKSAPGLQKTSYGRAVFLTIPAKLISNGEYEVTLKGADVGKLDDLAYYYFIAIKR